MPTATSAQLGGLLKEANDGLRPASLRAIVEKLGIFAHCI